MKNLKLQLSRLIPTFLVIYTVNFSQVCQLGKDYMVSTWEGKNGHIIFAYGSQCFDLTVLCRNKRKYGNADDYSTTCKAIKGIQVLNGLECKVSCSSSKVLHWTSTSFKYNFSNSLICKSDYLGAIYRSSSQVSYVLDTEDLLFRVRKRRRYSSRRMILNSPAHYVQVNDSEVQRFHNFVSSFIMNS